MPRPKVVILALVRLASPTAVIRVDRPAVPVAAVGSVRNCRVRVRPVADLGPVAVVNGRRIRFKPDWGFDKVAVQAVGRDGTVLLFSSYDGLYLTSQESIVHGQVEVPVLAYGHPATLDGYRDARNYAGSYYEDGDAPGPTPPRTEPYAFVREDGRARRVGRGSVVAWNPGGAVATKVQINPRGGIAVWEDDREDHARVFEGGRTYDLGTVAFVGRAADGAFGFADAETGALYAWRHLRIEPWARLPAGWQPVGADGRGGLLLRKGTDGWTLATLRGRLFRPLRFDLPDGASGLVWDTATFLRPNGTFGIEAYRGISAKPFRLTFSPR